MTRVCPTCGHTGPPPITPRCRCGHLRSEHRIDLQVARCDRGVRVPGLACDCGEFTTSVCGVNATAEAKDRP